MKLFLKGSEITLKANGFKKRKTILWKLSGMPLHKAEKATTQRKGRTIASQGQIKSFINYWITLMIWT